MEDKIRELDEVIDRNKLPEERQQEEPAEEPEEEQEEKLEEE